MALLEIHRYGLRQSKHYNVRLIEFNVSLSKVVFVKTNWLRVTLPLETYHNWQSKATSRSTTSQRSGDQPIGGTIQRDTLHTNF